MKKKKGKKNKLAKEITSDLSREIQKQKEVANPLEGLGLKSSPFDIQGIGGSASEILKTLNPDFGSITGTTFSGGALEAARKANIDPLFNISNVANSVTESLVAPRLPAYFTGGSYGNGVGAPLS